MLYEFAPVFLIDQSRDVEAPCVLAYRFLVRVEGVHDVFHGRPVVRGDVEQDLDTIMVRHPLEVAFHLLCGFELFHNTVFINYNM